MKKRKVFLTLAIMLLFVTFLTACGNEATADEESMVNTEPVNEEVAANQESLADEAGDGSADDVALAIEEDGEAYIIEGFIEESGDTYIIKRVKEIYARIWDQDVYENILYYLCYEDFSNEQAVVVRVDLDNPDNMNIIPLDIPSEQLVQQITISEGGSIHIMTVHNVEKNKWAETIDLFWHQIDGDGKIIRTTKMPEAVLERPYQVLYDFKVGSDGNAYFSMFSSIDAPSYDIFVINPAGELMFQEPLNTFIYLLKDTNGSVYVYHYTTVETRDGVTTAVISKIDIAAGSLNETDITPYSGGTPERGLFINKEELLILVNGKGVYDIDLKSGTMTERFTFSSIGVKMTVNCLAYPLSDGRILVANRGEDRLDNDHPVAYSVIRYDAASDVAAEEAKSE